VAFTDALLPLFSTTITRHAWVGISTDGYATATYAAAGSTYPARVVSEQRLVRSFEGTEELATTTVWVASTSTFDVADRWTYAGSVIAPLLAAETFRDEDGVTHSKLAFGS
jgi:hypothetical protein